MLYKTTRSLDKKILLLFRKDIYMKRRNVLIVAVLVGFLTMVGISAAAQKKKVKTSKLTQTKKVEKSEATKTKKIVLGEAALLGPAMLLGKAKELELTESQQAKLVAIMKEMQVKTMAVLTKAQAAKVKKWKPASTMAKTMKVALPTDTTKPSGTKTRMAKTTDGNKSKTKKIVK
jgi:hypothetical protein